MTEKPYSPRVSYLNVLRSESTDILIVDRVYGYPTRNWANEYATPERVGCIKIVLEERYDD